MRDPFGEFSSFAEHNNSKLKEFLDRYNFSYEFVSSTDYYTSGYFDVVLLRALASYDRIMEIMLPSLGQDRKESYSPFMPIKNRARSPGAN